MVSSLASLVFPARCPGCGVAAEPLCGICRAALRAAPSLVVPAGLDALRVPFAYDGVVRELIARAKYRRRHASLEWLAKEMIGVFELGDHMVDVVTWAPTTPRRQRERGFDQAELLARCIGHGLGRPVQMRLRRRSGAAQTGASRAVRAHRPVFVARINQKRGSAPDSVLLVDDVVTTGATLAAAAAALRGAGVNRIVGAAVARKA